MVLVFSYSSGSCVEIEPALKKEPEHLSRIYLETGYEIYLVLLYMSHVLSKSFYMHYTILISKNVPLEKACVQTWLTLLNRLQKESMLCRTGT